MKNLIILFLFAFIIIGCDNKSEGDEYNKKVQEELNSGVRKDTIFLGYTFGMTKKQFEERTYDLYKKGTLYLNENNNYAYKMYLDEILKNLEAVFEPKYLHKKLFELIVIVKDKGQLTTSVTPGLIQITLANLFAEKYGYGNSMKRKAFLDDKENYFFIQGNRQIEIIEGIGEARIIYTDLSRHHEFEQLKKEKSNNAKEDTKSNL